MRILLLSLVLLVFPISVIPISAMATTIIYDGKTMAADTQMTQGDRKWYGRQKIFQIQDPVTHRQYLVGTAGTIDVIDWFLKIWKKQGLNQAITAAGVKKWDSADELGQFMVADKETARLDVITIQSKAVNVFENHPYPYAIGTGHDFAMGALHAGVSCERAVSAAMKCDVNTGGDVVSERIK